MIKIENAKKSYDGFQLDCSFSIPKGTITGLVGSNGAGKSTAFKLFLNLISLDGGEVKLFGKDANSLTLQDKEKIGVVLTDTGFSEYLNANDISSILDSMYSNFDKKKFIHLCETLQLPRSKRLRDFSTGMKAKLKTIIALTHNAEILILDEVTTGLDVIVRNEILDLLREYMSEDDKRTILISSHISSDLENLCDDLYMIKDGRIVFHEDIDVLLGKYASLKLSEEQFESIDKEYILAKKTESYGYRCLTNERQYYLDNYPEIVIEKSNIDELMVIMNRGELL